MKKNPLSAKQQREWANTAQIAFLNGIASKSKLNIDNLAFQGGTSLSLGWGSPRFSEDLDFLLARGDAMDELKRSMPKIVESIRQVFLSEDPKFKIDVKGKERNGMLVFDIGISHLDVIGKSKVKTEFWGVDSEYFHNYDSEYKTPQHFSFSDNVFGNLKSAFPVPISTLESILADKVVALSYRNRLKWRDVFDVWWISQKLDRGLNSLSIEQITNKALHHVTAYNGPGLKAGVESFFNDKKEELLSHNNCDLDRWLPDAMSQVLNNNIDDMVSKTISLMSLVKDHINESTKESEIEHSEQPLGPSR